MVQDAAIGCRRAVVVILTVLLTCPTVALRTATPPPTALVCLAFFVSGELVLG